MFTEYFTKKATELEKSLRKALEKQGVRSPDHEKDLKVFQDFYTFLNEHVPEEFSIATGKVRNKRHLLNRDCDVLLYKKWCKRYLDLSGGYVLSDSLYGFLTLEAALGEAALYTHASLTRALKSLWSGDIDGTEQTIIPVYSILFAYGSAESLGLRRKQLSDFSISKEIPINQEVDMVCVLDQGLIIKDWESAGGYKVVETGSDTLMWFYILLMEYLDRESSFPLNLRDYIKNTREYRES